MSDLYVVRRRRCWWERPHELEEPHAVAVFVTRAEAEADAGERSRRYLAATRPPFNPFVVDWPTRDDAVQALASVTSFPPFALRDWLLDAGFPDSGPHAVPDATAGFHDWRDWGSVLFFDESEYYPHTGRWREVTHPYPFHADQLAVLWEAMNRYPVFEVVGIDWHPGDTRERP